ncbi:UDP-D-quinovosamine 4-dehydrogenase domain protein [Vibrio parahaemolyticus AQ3810]|nr:UDP-D-quinovosamine 4-dehydrogenase domain protein [Vibrio parahaemolyticus AQ3810]
MLIKKMQNQMVLDFAWCDLATSSVLQAQLFLFLKNKLHQVDQ